MGKNSRVGTYSFRERTLSEHQEFSVVFYTRLDFDHAGLPAQQGADT